MAAMSQRGGATGRKRATIEGGGQTLPEAYEILRNFRYCGAD
jgi:hypothetical protein